MCHFKSINAKYLVLWEIEYMYISYCLLKIWVLFFLQEIQSLAWISGFIIVFYESLKWKKYGLYQDLLDFWLFMLGFQSNHL